MDRCHYVPGVDGKIDIGKEHNEELKSLELANSMSASNGFSFCLCKIEVFFFFIKPLKELNNLVASF